MKDIHQQVHDELQQNGSLIAIDEFNVEESLQELFKNHEVRRRMSESALSWVSANQGATAKHIKLIDQLLSTSD